MTTIAVTATTSALFTAAKEIAAACGLAWTEDMATQVYDYLLVLTPDYLGLQKTSDKKFHPFYIDFLSGKMRYRQEQAGLRKELLARALGVKPGEQPVIVDATAGLGRDSFILATLGFSVIMLEKSPIMHQLLQNGLQRAKMWAPGVIQRLNLIKTEATAWLTQHSSTYQPDIIYLDPMFPPRQKTASVKKEMAFLHDLLVKDDNVQDLLKIALACAKQRVVVKRPRLAANIGDMAPNFTLTGKSSRFDVYLTIKR